MIARRAGCAGWLFHDLRRTSERAGTPAERRRSEEELQANVRAAGRHVARRVDFIGLLTGAVYPRRYREIPKEEVVGTVADPEETEDELRYLLAAVSS